MSPEAQRVAIAEWMGWRRGESVNAWTEEITHWVNPRNLGQDLPDFTNDLNAIHAAEKHLKDSQIKQYVANIWRAMHLSPEAFIGTIHATAAQRCEALLRTLDLWSE